MVLLWVVNAAPIIVLAKIGQIDPRPGFIAFLACIAFVAPGNNSLHEHGVCNLQ